MGQQQQKQKQITSSIETQHDATNNENNLACRSPDIPVNASALMVKFKPHPPIDCGAKTNPDWVFVDAGKIYFRSTGNAADVLPDCKLTPVTRVDDFKVKLE